MNNLARADAFLAALAVAGVRHCVLAPGARSAPLAAAALRRPDLTCHVIHDERAAGFFALGIGKATGRPAAVLTTSGTAAANLLPAIVEANLAHVPLLALTADRPPEALGWGANQTIDQAKLYGAHVRASHALPVPDAAVGSDFLSMLAARLVRETLGPLPGPVHANCPFREPLLPEDIPAPSPVPAVPEILSAAPAAPAGLDALAARLAARPGVILCGEARYPEGFADAIARLAATLGSPIIAEVLSGLRCGAHDRSHLVAGAARLLRDPAALPAPAWVLRFGGFPVSRVLERWLNGLAGAEHLLVASPGDWPDPLRNCTTRIESDPLAVVEAMLPHCRRVVAADFFQQWRMAEAKLPPPQGFFEGSIAHALIKTLPADAQLFVGNSLAIRALDAFGGTRGTPLALHGNRGASGIDGNLATTAGIAVASGRPTFALLGDQTLLHDATSLALAARHGVTVVLLDNGGGRIFEHLPFAPALPPELLARGWLVPPTVDWSALASAFGLRYAEARDGTGFAAALRQSRTDGAWLLRTVIDPAVSRAGMSR